MMTTSITLVSAALCLFVSALNNVDAIDQPNVLFIVIDDLRPSLGCYGGPIISPNIDQLAAQSALFTNAMVQQSLCGPSRTSFLTGRRPDTTRLYDFGSYWRDVAGNFTTIPQHFKENGYFTASVGKVFHPGVPSGGNDDYPYSWSIPAYHPSTELYNRSKVCPNMDGTLHNNIMCPVDVENMPEKTLPDIQAFDRAAEILRNLSERARKSPTMDGSAPTSSSTADDVDGGVTKQPFFLGVGFRKPHVPWKYPKEYQDLYPIESVDIANNPNIPEKLPSVAWDDYHSLRLRDDLKALHLDFPYGTIPLDYHAPMRQNYYAATSYTDYQVGQLLHTLEETGFANNTIILFVGDHGWQLGEHGEWCKFSNFQLATRVPLLVHVPGLTDTGRSTSAPFKFPLKDPFQEFATRRQLHSKKTLVKNSILPINAGRKSDKYYQYEVIGEEELNEISPGTGGHDKMPREQGLQIDEFVELVDMFPTLSELANLAIPPVCPEKPFGVEFCAEGVSFAPLITSHAIRNRGNDTGMQSFASSLTEKARNSHVVQWKNATFSQYPRPGVNPGKTTDVPHLLNITIMGYSMRTRDYHYAEWIGFNHTTFEGDWTDVKARELYLNDADPAQNNNVAGNQEYKKLVADLSRKLQRGWRDCLPDIQESES